MFRVATVYTITLSAAASPVLAGTPLFFVDACMYYNRVFLPLCMYGCKSVRMYMCMYSCSAVCVTSSGFLTLQLSDSHLELLMSALASPLFSKMWQSHAKIICAFRKLTDFKNRLKNHDARVIILLKWEQKNCIRSRQSSCIAVGVEPRTLASQEQCCTQFASDVMTCWWNVHRMLWIYCRLPRPLSFFLGFRRPNLITGLRGPADGKHPISHLGPKSLFRTGRLENRAILLMQLNEH